MRSYYQFILVGGVLLNGCATTKVADHLQNNQCEKAQRSLKDQLDEIKLSKEVKKPLVNYIVVPSTYLVGYSLAAITFPIYIIGSPVAVAAHDTAQFLHEGGIFIHYEKIGVSGGKFKGITAAYQGDKSIRYYSTDRGIFPYAQSLLREPLTTQLLRESYVNDLQPKLHRYYANKLLVAQCFANRQQAQDNETAIVMLRDFEKDSKAPDVMTLDHSVRDAYRQLKTLEDPQWASLNPKLYGPSAQGKGLKLFLRGVIPESESEYAH
jgi:hypothetical protein